MLRVRETDTNTFLVDDPPRKGVILVDMAGTMPRTRSITYQRNLDPTSGDGLAAVEAVLLHLDHHPGIPHPNDPNTDHYMREIMQDFDRFPFS